MKKRKPFLPYLFDVLIFIIVFIPLYFLLNFVVFKDLAAANKSWGFIGMMTLYILTYIIHYFIKYLFKKFIIKK